MALKNNRGIRLLDTQLNSSLKMAGKYDLLYHTNGSIYVAFARDNVSSREIWMAYSADGGTTFTSPVQISVADTYWHDNPALCQLDLTNTSSDIGLIFTKTDHVWSYDGNLTSNYPYRTTVNTTLSVVSAIDILTDVLPGNNGLTICKTPIGYLAACLTSAADTVRFYSNTDAFTDNSWVVSDVSGFTGLRSVRVRTLANGHIALIGAVDQGTGCNIGVRFSVDYGGTWGAVQYLTSYSGTEILDLASFKQCLDVDIAELGANQLAIVYQEGTRAQFLTSTSTPSLSSATYGTTPVFHDSKNLLFIPINASTHYTANNGIWVYSLTSHTFVAHLTAGGFPPLWNEEVACIALSPDGNYLAVATHCGGLSTAGSGSLDIFDISDADPINWTVTSIRTSTSPALASSNVGWCAFSDNTTLLFGYLSSSVGTSAVWGGKINADTPTSITPLTSPAAGVKYLSAGAVPYVDSIDGKIYIASSGYTWVNLISDGTLFRQSTLSGSPNKITYDNINNEWVAFSPYIQRLNSSGALLETVTPPKSINSGCAFSGSGIMLTTNEGYMWYDFHAQKLTGPLNKWPDTDNLGFDISLREPIETSLLDGSWVVSRSSRSNGYHFHNIASTGELFWNIFTYNPSTHQVGADTFYSFCDTRFVPATDALHLVKPRICKAPMDDVCLAAFRYFPTRSGTQPLALIAGTMNRDNRTLTMRARIKNTVNPDDLEIRARIAKRVTLGPDDGTALEIKARIVYAQCLKMMARIIPVKTETIQIRACIFNWKSSIVPMSYTVTRSGQQVRIGMQFTANTGFVASRSFTAQARILQKAQRRMTGHFLVTATIDNSAALVVSPSSVNYVHTLSMKAFIL
jgi:hypothetical protein